MTARQGFIIPIIFLGSIVIIFTLVLLTIKTNFSQKDTSLQDSPKTEVDPLPGWKTYSNKINGFTIRYPKQWYVREYESYAANFTSTGPSLKEATSQAVKVRFSQEAENIDLAEFEKIYKLKPQAQILEPLDVKSVITKNKNFDVNGLSAVDFLIERSFSAPVGPRREFTHVYEVKKEKAILRFSTSSSSLEELTRVNDPILTLMISSLKTI